MYIHTLPINADRPIFSQFSSRLLLSSVLCLFSFLCFSSILSCALVFFFPFLFSSEMINVVHLGGGGTFTTRFDKVAAIGVSELLLLLLVESESDSSRSLRKWLHFTHFFRTAPKPSSRSSRQRLAENSFEEFHQKMGAHSRCFACFL